MRALVDLVDAMVGKTVVVVGDAIMDRYIFGRVDRLSPEAPVPVFIPERQEDRPGGAANVQKNLSQLGIITRESFAFLEHRCRKTRYMVGHQMLLRVDEEKSPPPSSTDDLLGMVTGKKPGGILMDVPPADAVVISDYGKGWLTDGRLQAVIEFAIEARIPVVVDPKRGDWERYRGATVVCPNERELGMWTHDWTPPHILEKHGARGLRLVREGNSFDGRWFPSKAQQVFDVTGAGDTVVAVVAATLAAGGSMPQAAQLANLAAGQVVGAIGTAACPHALLHTLAIQEDP